MAQTTSASTPLEETTPAPTVELIRIGTRELTALERLRDRMVEDASRHELSVESRTILLARAVRDPEIRALILRLSALEFNQIVESQQDRFLRIPLAEMAAIVAVDVETYLNCRASTTGEWDSSRCIRGDLRSAWQAVQTAEYVTRRFGGETEPVETRGLDALGDGYYTLYRSVPDMAARARAAAAD